MDDKTKKPDPVIMTEAARISKAFLDQVEQEAFEKIDSTLRSNQRDVKREKALRIAELNQLRNLNSLDSEYNDTCADPVHREEREPSDPSLQALQSVVECYDDTEIVVRMPELRQVPPYDTWVPVRHDFFDRADPPDPFVPYFGDSRRLRKKAHVVYKQMQEDNPHATLDISDGELDHSTNRFKPPRDDSFYDLRNRRRRQAERHTMKVITSRYGTHPSVNSALATVFSKCSDSVMSAVGRVANGREQAKQDAIRRREKLERQTQAIGYVFLKGEDKQPDADITISSTAHAATARALRYFCFTCHTFACEIHDGRNAQPVEPIPDLVLNRRISRLSNNRATPCGPQCFLRAQSSPARAVSSQPWTFEELNLLSEARELHGEDPCILAVILHPRTCRQVHSYMQSVSLPSSPAETPLKSKAGAIVTIIDSSDSECDEPESSIPVVPFQVKDEIRLNGLTHTPFVPCNHKGACTEENGCICAKNNLYCEPLCGCRTGRYSMGKNGMVWKGKRDGSGRPKICENRHGGCSCHGNKTKCVLESCPCVRDMRACDPDFCSSCQASVLPQFTSISQRRCGNTDLIAARHKRVFVGPSNIHGFGLFSGQNFDRGDLLGPYCGRIMFSDALDRELRLPQAKKSTYAFNLTHDMTIDAGLVGSKVKFINHSDNNNTINCKSQMRRVRGDCRICIVTTRPIKAGVELLMNYELDQGNGWLENGNSDADDNDDDGDDDESSDDSENDVSFGHHEAMDCVPNEDTFVM